MPDVTGEEQISHDITGEQQISDSAWAGQLFLLATSRPIRIECGTKLLDNNFEQL